MAKGKLLALAAPFQGRCRIAEMDLWDQDAHDLVAPASLEIDGSEGEMCFIAGRLVGHLYFHMGDDSGFVCEPW